MSERHPALGQISRHYGMDWLRIGAFGLLILYHLGMVFVPWGYHIKTDVVQDWVEYPMLLLNPWRLSLLFLVSGFASRALLSKGTLSPGRFLHRRAGRLLLPLLFGIAIFVAPQSWAEFRHKTGYDEDFITFWLNDYWSFAFVQGVPMPTYNHLWFILYLFTYTLLLVLALWFLPPAVKQRTQALFDRLFSNAWLWLALPALYLVLCLGLVPAEGLPPQIFVGDWYRHAVYLAMFLIGYGLAGSKATWGAIRKSWRWALAIALLAYAAAMSVIFGDVASALDQATRAAVVDVLKAIQAWGAIAGLVGLADRFWNRDAPLRQYLALGVFPFYIIHQTIIILVALWTLEAGLSVAAQFTVNLAATVVGCWLFYELALRSGPVRPLFGLRQTSR